MGRAAALAFAREGACIVINDVSEENLNSTADDIRAAGGVVTPVQGDVTKSDSIRATVAGALDQYSRVDILFNYVGGEPGRRPPPSFTEQTEEYWGRTIELNLKSTVIFSRAVLDSA